MMRFSVIFVLINSVLIINSVIADVPYRPPVPKVIFFKEGGFEVSIFAQEGVSAFAVRFKKNESFDPDQLTGEYISKTKNGRFIFINLSEKFEIGDILYFSSYVIYNGEKQNLLDLSEEVTDYGFPTTPVPGPKTTVFDEPSFQFLPERGFEVSMPAREGISLMTMHFNLNKSFEKPRPGDFSANVTKPIDGKLSIRDLSIKFKIGDKLYFWVYLIFEGFEYFLLQQMYTYRNEIPCKTGVTKTNGRDNICVNTEIFREDFDDDSLNLSTWSYEKKFALDPDHEFVYYNTHNAQLFDGILRITPQQSRNLSYFEIPGCTGIPKTPECVYDRSKTRDFFHPIVSSRINTEKSFSFQYGRIEVRAKLPRANWVVPQILLSPKDSKYDKEEYKSGQIRIACIENNPSKRAEVKQGPLLGAKEPFRTSFMNAQPLSSLGKNWDSDYHIFAIEWRPDGITTFIDNDQYQIQNWHNNRINDQKIPGSEKWDNSDVKVAPFDQELFIMLGVSVGGINDFSSGTPWDLRSPLQKRQFVTSQHWNRGWYPDKRKMEIDYVKVYAV